MEKSLDITNPSDSEQILLSLLALHYIEVPLHINIECIYLVAVFAATGD